MDPTFMTQQSMAGILSEYIPFMSAFENSPTLKFMVNFVLLSLAGMVTSNFANMGGWKDWLKDLMFPRRNDRAELKFTAKDMSTSYDVGISGSNEFKAWLTAIRRSMMVFDKHEVGVPTEDLPPMLQKKSEEKKGKSTPKSKAPGSNLTKGKGDLVKLMRVAEFRERRSIWSDDNEKAASTQWLPNTEDEFQIDEHIWVQFSSSDFNEGDDGNNKRKIREYSLTIFVKDVKYRRYLFEYHEALMHEYYEEQKRTLTSQPHVFELLGDGGEDEGGEGTDLKWHMCPFSSTRKLEHVWFKQRDQFLSAYENFLNNRNAYERRGDPYTFSALLTGLPGCGKSSLIKAIIQDSLHRGKMRHVFIINFDKITSSAMLSKVFFESQVNGHHIPSSDRIMIFEDFSACKQGKVFLKRNLSSIHDDDDIRESLMRRLSSASRNNSEAGSDDEEGAGSKKKDEAGDDKDSKDEATGAGDDDAASKVSRSGSLADLAGLSGLDIGPKKPSFKLSLSEILNTLDGINERTGSIALWTTNRALHTYDPAFLRPGRMDIIVEFTRADVKGLQYLIDQYFSADYATAEEARPHMLAAALEGDVSPDPINVLPLTDVGVYSGKPAIPIKEALTIVDDRFTPAELKQACKESRSAFGTVQLLVNKLAERIKKEQNGGVSAAPSRPESPTKIGGGNNSTVMTPIKLEIEAEK